MTEEVSTETEEEAPPPAPPPRPPSEEKPIFNLEDLLRARRGKGEGVGFWEVLAYLDYKDRREEREWRRAEMETMKRSPQSSSPNPDVEALKTQVSELQQTVGDLLETIRSERQEKAQKDFVEGVVKQTTDKIMPSLEALKERLEAYEKIPTTEPTETSELKEIRDSLKEITDKIGEKIGAKGLTLTDVDQLLGVIETLEKRIGKKGEGGEVDYKTMAVSTVGEIGKELITAYRDIATSGGRTEGFEAPQTETPASTMQTIIKRQVQNYITQRMTVGATKMNIQEAAKELGLTPGQVMWAYQTLMKEGWFHVEVPSKGKRKVKQHEVPEEASPTETSEEEQVFNPPET